MALWSETCSQPASPRPRLREGAVGSAHLQLLTGDFLSPVCSASRETSHPLELPVFLKAPSEAPCRAAGFPKGFDASPNPFPRRVWGRRSLCQGAAPRSCHSTVPCRHAARSQQPSPSSLPPPGALFGCYFHPSTGLPVFLLLRPPPPSLSCSSLIGHSGCVRGEPCDLLYNQVLCLERPQQVTRGKKLPPPTSLKHQPTTQKQTAGSTALPSSWDLQDMARGRERERN